MDKEIKLLSLKSEQVNIDTSLALRFLRVRQEPDERTKEIFRSCLLEFLSVVSYKASYRYFDIKIDGDVVHFGDEMSLQSEKLVKNLSGCKGAFVFVASTNSFVDMLIRKHNSTNVTRALIIDAIGSSAIECFCNVLCEKIAQDNNIALRPRFSPGYGDLGLVTQRDVLKSCDSLRKIGVTLTERLMMIPRKSVSAIVGVRPENEKCTKASSCENCESTTCPYRE